jgi:hypothetical protein
MSTQQQQPPRGPVFSIPDDLLRDLTMNGTSQLVVHWFYGDTSAPTLTFSKEKFQNCKERIRQAIARKESIYYSSDVLLPEVFEDYPIRDESVTIIGSASPLYEAYVDHFGGKPITIEYRPIQTDIPGLKTYTVEEALAAKLRSDYALCISSIEHSGLGRYGDTVDPDGDLRTMEMVRDIVRPGGLFYLQVPVGIDTVIWNAERIYGQFRLLLLLKGWKLLAAYGYDRGMLHRGGGLTHGAAGEPIFVLQNADPGDSHKILFDQRALDGFSSRDASRSRWDREFVELAHRFVAMNPEHVRVDWDSRTGSRLGAAAWQRFKHLSGRVARKIDRHFG